MRNAAYVLAVLGCVGCGGADETPDDLATKIDSMTTLAPTLAAISLGAVFMGANTYIGNAPNFMVYAIAKDAGVRMPSFFGYMVWSCVFLLPLFGLVTWLYFV